MSHETENERYAEECLYLTRLLETQGNRDVPRGSVRSYFAVQAAGARRARFHCLAYTLESIAKSELSDAEAIVALRAHAAALSRRLLTAPASEAK